MDGGETEPRFRLMKKNDILRVRIDAATLAALKRACDASGCSISQILRESIDRELVRRNERSEVASESAGALGPAFQSVALDEQSTCARILSSLLITGQMRPREDGARLLQRQRRIARLLESLFQVLRPEGRPSTYGRNVMQDGGSPAEVVSASEETDRNQGNDAAPAAYVDPRGSSPKQLCNCGGMRIGEFSPS